MTAIDYQPAASVAVARRASSATASDAARRTLTATLLGLVGSASVPLAPPRTLPGFIDTMTRYGHKDWWGSAASVPKGLGWFTNHYLFASVAGLVVLLTGFAPSRAAFRLGWLKPPPSLIGA